jgi:L-arabinonolactonase
MDDGFPVKVIGKFHRLNAATLTVETLALPEVAIPNSICFSPDGGTLYYCDSMQGWIMCCDYPSLQNQRVFAKVEGDGAPDGSCVDATGCLWNAEWGGSRVVRYLPDGSTDVILLSPGIQSTCPALAGENFTRLCCTTASVGLTTLSEYDGQLLKAESDVSPGLAESRFAAHTI